MQQYRVVDRWTEERRCALKSSMGRFHVARALHVMPPLEACLHGDEPRLGFGIFQCAESSSIFRMNLEFIDDLQPAAQLERTQSETP